MVDAKGFPDHHRPITTSLDALGFQGPRRSPERRHGRHGGSSTTTLEALGLQPPTDWYLKQQPAANVEEAADAADHEDNRFGPVGDLKAAHKVILRCDKLG